MTTVLIVAETIGDRSGTNEERYIAIFMVESNYQFSLDNLIYGSGGLRLFDMNIIQH